MVYYTWYYLSKRKKYTKMKLSKGLIFFISFLLEICCCLGITEDSLWLITSKNPADSIFPWISTASTSSGSTVYALASNTGLFQSTDYGQNWEKKTILTSNPSPTWTSVATSTDGKYVSALYTGNPCEIWISQNYGVTWIQAFTTASSFRYFSHVELSATGQWQYAIQSQLATSSIYVSSTFGTNWGYNAYSSVLSITILYSSVRCSTVSNYMILLEKVNPVVLVFSNGVTSTSSVTSTSTLSGSLIASAISSTGIFQFILSSTSIFSSLNYGANFNIIAGSESSGFSYSAIVADGTGQFVVVGTVNNGLIISSNYGSTFQASTSFSSLSNFCSDLSSNLIGDYVIAVSSGIGIFTTYGDFSPTNSPTPYIPGSPTLQPSNNPTIVVTTITPSIRVSSIPTLVPSSTAKPSVSLQPTFSDENNYFWFQVDDTSKQLWSSVAVSSNGKYQSACVFNGQIYVSSDYGLSWSTSGSSLAWESIDISDSGQYQTAVVNNGNIYISSDYGKTFTGVSGNYLKIWISISMSGTGQYQTAAIKSSTLYRSTNYGVTWTSAGGSNDWESISVSSLGQYQAAAAYYGLLYFSSNFGSTWTASSFENSWTGIAISSSGMYVTAVASINSVFSSNDYGSNLLQVVNDDNNKNYAVDMSIDGKNQVIAVINNGINCVLISTTFGNSWSKSIPRQSSFLLSDISISSDGYYITTVENGGYILRTSVYSTSFIPTPSPTFTMSPVSSNIEWNPVTASNTWIDVAISGTGQYITAIVPDENVYISNNFGLSFSLSINVRKMSYQSVAMSKDGKYQTIVPSLNNITISSDYGSTWSYVSNLPLHLSFHDVSISDSGNYQVCTVNPIDDTGYLYVSTDYGRSWVSRGNSLQYTLGSANIAISSIGQYQTVAVSSGSVFVSSDYQTSWTETGFIANWNSITMSSTGQYQTAVISNGFVFVSSNFGLTWIQSGSSKVWTSNSMSSSGSTQIACVYGGNAYISYDYGSSWLETGPFVNWNSISMSSNGNYIVAAVYNGPVYIGINSVQQEPVSSPTNSPNALPVSSPTLFPIALPTSLPIKPTATPTLVPSDFTSSSNTMTFMIHITLNGVSDANISDETYSLDNNEINAIINTIQTIYTNDVVLKDFVQLSCSSLATIIANNNIVTEVIVMIPLAGDVLQDATIDIYDKYSSSVTTTSFNSFFPQQVTSTNAQQFKTANAILIETSVYNIVTLNENVMSFTTTISIDQYLGDSTISTALQNDLILSMSLSYFLGQQVDFNAPYYITCSNIGTVQSGTLTVILTTFIPQEGEYASYTIGEQYDMLTNLISTAFKAIPIGGYNNFFSLFMHENGNEIENVDISTKSEVKFIVNSNPSLEMH